jgi:hypothetical protein
MAKKEAASQAAFVFGINVQLLVSDHAQVGY